MTTVALVKCASSVEKKNYCDETLFGKSWAGGKVERTDLQQCPKLEIDQYQISLCNTNAKSIGAIS